MNVLTRVWRAYADPGRSEAAKALKVVIPLELAAYAYRVVAPADWPTLSGVTLVEVFAWCLMLWFVRQRDEARATSTTNTP